MARGCDIFALAISGALAAFGGAYLSLASTGVFIENMTGGRGYIALAILILGGGIRWA